MLLSDARCFGGELAFSDNEDVSFGLEASSLVSEVQRHGLRPFILRYVPIGFYWGFHNWIPVPFKGVEGKYDHSNVMFVCRWHLRHWDCMLKSRRYLFFKQIT